jgi:hypothetical protein
MRLDAIILVHECTSRPASSRANRAIICLIRHSLILISSSYADET